MLKNKLVGFAATTNLKLQNLDPVYTRLLNKNIDITQIKKVNSEKKIIKAAGQSQPIEEKSLKNRVLDITKLNQNLNIFSPSAIPSPKIGTQKEPSVASNKTVVGQPQKINTGAAGTGRVGIKTNLSSHLSPNNKSILGGSRLAARQESKILDFKIKIF